MGILATVKVDQTADGGDYVGIPIPNARRSWKDRIAVLAGCRAMITDKLLHDDPSSAPTSHMMHDGFARVYSRTLALAAFVARQRRALGYSASGLSKSVASMHEQPAPEQFREVSRSPASANWT
jgi:hypothetical protein